MTGATRQSSCERTRAWAALAPDGELSLLERRLLDAHLTQCAGCRFLAEQVATIAEQLRVAPLERFTRPFVLPATPVRAVAAVATMASGIATQAPLECGGERPSAPRGSAPAEVDDAELHSIRQLRWEALLIRVDYPDRPSRTFGNQPA